MPTENSHPGQLTRRQAIGLLGATIGSLGGATAVNNSTAQVSTPAPSAAATAAAKANQWLAQVVEQVIEPEIPIIDSHHHLWRRDGIAYVLDDFLADIKGNNVRQTVFVQANSMYRADGPEAFRVVGEVEWVNGIAAESASGIWGETRVATAIVGGGNLLLGDDVAPVLEAQMAASRRFRGIRHSVGYTDPPVRPQITKPHMLADPTYRKGFSHLHRYGLSFEAWLYYNQLHDLVELARAFPETTIILNHLGGLLGVGAWQGRIEEVFKAWKPAIAEVATCPNIYAKVGGLGMGYLNGFGWEKRSKPPTSDELLAVNRRWFDHTIEVFGPNRCMFESNFPPDKGSSSYTVLWNQFKKLTKSFSKLERAAMFHDTAMRVYRLARV
jgi:predicted TIM-barrel fold metal-dependent hydrolase